MPSGWACEPVMRLKSSISTIKTFDPDTDISYGRTFRTTARTRIGVLPIGYADGFFRGLSNRMSVVTDQGPAPHAGPDLHGHVHGGPDGSAGREGGGRRWRSSAAARQVDDLAALLDTIPYELTCAVSQPGAAGISGGRQDRGAEFAPAVSAGQ